MDQNSAGARQQHGRTTLADWLGRHEVGPGDDRPDSEREVTDQRFAEWRCSVCGRQLAEHIVDQAGEHTVFECPVSIDEGERLVGDGPLSETGQTKH